MKHLSLCRCEQQAFNQIAVLQTESNSFVSICHMVIYLGGTVNRTCLHSHIVRVFSQQIRNDTILKQVATSISHGCSQRPRAKQWLRTTSSKHNQSRIFLACTVLRNIEVIQSIHSRTRHQSYTMCVYSRGNHSLNEWQSMNTHRCLSGLAPAPRLARPLRRSHLGIRACLSDFSSFEPRLCDICNSHPSTY